MSKQLIIRSVVETDFESWLPLWDGYNHFYGQDSMPYQTTQTIWSRFFDDTEQVHAIVAELNGTLIGFAHYIFHRTTSRVDLNCYLHDLFIAESMRRQGTARKLIEEVCRRASCSGSHKIYWQTQSNNTIARSLYDKVAENYGFIVYSKPLVHG